MARGASTAYPRTPGPDLLLFFFLVTFVLLIFRFRLLLDLVLLEDVGRELVLCGTDAVAELFSRETRRVSDGHADGVAATRHRVDAIDATTSQFLH